MKWQKMTWSIFLFFAGVGIVAEIYGVYIQHRVEFRVLGVEIADWGQERGFMVIHTELEAHNPTARPLKVEALNVELFAGGFFLGNQKVDKLEVLPAGRRRKVSLDVNVFLGGLGESKWEALSQKPISWELRLSYTVRARYGKIPYHLILRP
ncbi:MAG: hypothetical protein V2G52_01790 [bacterium JZ-2024 1]